MEIEIFVDAVQHEPVGAGRKMRRLTPAEVHQRAKSFRANWLARELGDPSQEPHVAHVLTRLRQCLRIYGGSDLTKSMV